MTTPETDPCSEEDRSLPALWAAARYLLDCLKAALGGPCSIAARGVLTLGEYQDIAVWIAPIERAVRRLLLIEAAALAPSLGEPSPPRAASAPQEPAGPRQAFIQDPDNSAHWRVRFAALPRLRASIPSKDSPPADARDPDEARSLAGLGVYCAWPLAERAEAVARVLADPAPHARRLALRLRRDAARSRERAAALVRPPDPSGRQRPTVFGRWVNTHARAQAEGALEAFDTS